MPAIEPGDMVVYLGPDHKCRDGYRDALNTRKVYTVKRVLNTENTLLCSVCSYERNGLFLDVVPDRNYWHHHSSFRKITPDQRTKQQVILEETARETLEELHKLLRVVVR